MVMIVIEYSVLENERKYINCFMGLDMVILH